MRGVMSYVIVFIFLSIFLASVFILVTPMLMSFNAHIIKESTTIINSSAPVIEEVQDPYARTELKEVNQEMLNAQLKNQKILSSFVKYAWAIILSVTFVVIYLRARRDVEFSWEGRG